MQGSILERLRELEHQFEDVTSELVRPEVIADTTRYQELVKQHAELEEIVDSYRRLQAIDRCLAETRGLLEEADEEMRTLADEEIDNLGIERSELESHVFRLLLPKDPDDQKNVVLEVRAGTGGEEAALFAADIYRMYQRFAERRGWRVEVLNENLTGTGGFKEVIVLIEGKGAYSRFKYESGVHRVQRVPKTEASGRIHTSAVTVAVMPEAEDVEIDINPSDLRIDRYCSSGPGGQSVNTTQSAIRITHIPTGLVVTCQDEKSQHKNKSKALRVLRARLFDLKLQEQHDQIAANRRGQVGSGDRSEKIRTYNFPQHRVTDHRIHLTLHSLTSVLDGQLDPILDELITAFEAERLREQLQTEPH